MTRRVRGYYDMGRIQIPPLPQGMVFTDRDDGTLWLLSHNRTEPSVDGNGYIAITDQLPRRVDYRVFEANGEPHFPDYPYLRLFVRGGRLGLEFQTLPVGLKDQDQGAIVSRRASEKTLRSLFLPEAFASNPNTDVLAWAPVEA